MKLLYCTNCKVAIHLHMEAMTKWCHCYKTSGRATRFGGVQICGPCKVYVVNIEKGVAKHVKEPHRLIKRFPDSVVWSKVGQQFAEFQRE